MQFILYVLKKLNIYIIKQYIGTFIFTFFVAIFILLMQFLWTWVDEFIGKGVEFAVMFKLLFYTSVTFVPMALPLAILLSSLMCFGNLGEYYELVAMKASGISTWKVMRPLLYFSLTMSVLGFFFSNNVMPVANLKMQSTLYDVSHKKMTLEIPEGVFYRGIDKYVIKVAKKSKDGNWMYDVMIYDHTDGKGNVKVTVADSGYMAMTPSQREMIFTLYDGYNYNEVIDDKDYRTHRPFQKMKFKRQIVMFDMSQFDMKHMSEDAFKNHQTMLNIRQLNIAIDSLNILYDNKLESNSKTLINRLQNLNTTVEHFVKADKKLKKRHGDAVSNDTITVFEWPLLNNLPEKERQAVLSIASSSTNNMKESISITNNDIKRQRINIRKHEQVLNQKFTLSVACILFFFIGAPLGAIIRKGGLGMPVVVSVVFFVIYYVITIIGERVAVNGDMSVFLGAWISSIVLFPIGIFLTFKATTDAALLDADSWKKLFSKRNKSKTT
ncbi:MAG: LptF/LptG family permease [Bacteroidales bacterium]|nr:LptF/LptG family permease [Bacteroidales bacterium]